MRLVFDTNVFVSALLTPGGTSDRAVRAATASGATLLYDARMLAEYSAVLSRAKFRAVIAPSARDRLLAALVSTGERVEAHSHDLHLPDPDDVPFLQVALTGRADALVTGNSRHFQPSHGVAIVSPSGLLLLLSVR